MALRAHGLTKNQIYLNPCTESAISCFYVLFVNFSIETKIKTSLLISHFNLPKKNKQKKTKPNEMAL